MILHKRKHTNRVHAPLKCKHCNEPIEKDSDYLAANVHNVYHLDCINKHSKEPQTKQCANCQEELNDHKKKYGAKFCGSYCQRTMLK